MQLPLKFKAFHHLTLNNINVMLIFLQKPSESLTCPQQINSSSIHHKPRCSRSSGSGWCWWQRWWTCRTGQKYSSRGRSKHMWCFLPAKRGGRRTGWRAGRNRCSRGSRQRPGWRTAAQSPPSSFSCGNRSPEPVHCPEQRAQLDRRKRTGGKF